MQFWKTMMIFIGFTQTLAVSPVPLCEVSDSNLCFGVSSGAVDDTDLQVEANQYIFNNGGTYSKNLKLYNIVGSWEDACDSSSLDFQHAYPYELERTGNCFANSGIWATFDIPWTNIGTVATSYEGITGTQGYYKFNQIDSALHSVQRINFNPKAFTDCTEVQANEYQCTNNGESIDVLCFFDFCHLI